MGGLHPTSNKRPFNCPWAGCSKTNGMMERFNGRISDALATRRYDAGGDLEKRSSATNVAFEFRIERAIQ
ncbi:hypothetical protein DXI23_04655 [Marinobacter flavimaris]|uniref:Integrase catalytic domain-containing protein n=1 Tax=Marinobacter flavimaris TaxID=262076 RepID=A0A3D8H8A9_9GAMM|nr:hypothetical protein MDHKLMBL_20320 [Marinobacter flavimaris]RDU42953.1 hypothetical protein DXI23_04655 [Marinobacter flavimaris]